MPIETPLATTLPEKETTAQMAISLFNDFVGTAQNVWLVIGAIAVVIAASASVFLIRRKTVKYTRSKINDLVATTKYIPGLFVELNDCKETLRYFIYGKKWKGRIIQRFNELYDNSYGDILRNGSTDPELVFHLEKHASLEQIKQAVDKAYQYHCQFRSQKADFKPEYIESKVLFEVHYYPYIEELETIQKMVKAATCRYLIVTGSAGNGKTNLLCSLSELLLRNKQAVVFINAREIDKQVDDYILERTKISDFWKKHKQLYFKILNCFLSLGQKYYFVVIDAVNENDQQQTKEDIRDFVINYSRYSRIKIMVSCRNEYYEKRFKSALQDEIPVDKLQIDIKDEQYSEASINRMIRRYKDYFHFNGNISSGVIDVLSRHLLLLRIFFETYRGTTENVETIHKHELFNKYLDTISAESKGETAEDIEFIINKMLQSECFDGVSGKDVDSYYSGRKLDDYVLLGKKLVSHPGTIIEEEQEQVFFVFDELRDYCLAKAVIQKHISDQYEPNEVIQFLKNANRKNLSCEEGIAQFAYAFFKKDEEVRKRNETEKYCKEILAFYKDNKVSYNHMTSREEFRCLGLRIIFAMNEKLSPFEFDYIREILNKENERFDTGLLFEMAVRGTINSNPFDIDEYIETVIGLNSWNKLGQALLDASNFDYLHENHYPDALFSLFEKAQDQTKRLQLQKALVLFELVIDFSADEKRQSEFVKRCNMLPNHKEIKEALMRKIKEACVE